MTNAMVATLLLFEAVWTLPTAGSLPTPTFNPVVDRHLRFQPELSPRGYFILTVPYFTALAEYWTNDVKDIRIVIPPATH